MQLALLCKEKKEDLIYLEHKGICVGDEVWKDTILAIERRENWWPSRQELVLKLVLKLKDIVEIVVAPAVQQSQVVYLKILVEEYLDERQRLLHQKLRPKHHFLSHYPWLILKFGPLIKVWPLRFESKQTFFKRCVRNSSNFKNVTATLPERHQLLQAYSSEGQLFPDSLKTDRGTAFEPGLYSSSIQNAVASRSILQHTYAQVSDEVSVFGTEYRKGMYVIISLGNTAVSSTNKAEVVEKLLEVGVEKPSDIQYVDEGDLELLNLKKVQMRKLIKDWDKGQVDGVTIGTGYDSLVSQLVNRVDNNSRQRSPKLKRKITSNLDAKPNKSAMPMAASTDSHCLCLKLKQKKATKKSESN
ncbi:hypothetical protein HOLleu_04451 [Holothuria leucospilota]|uniref:Uncharacterized protein n=1 Tax=Holothuria leucospilota TaxID=206669 RepID=A0A9Q1CTB0_HOLLE|nr:hypothetical protein HOLleu_04451 [Holothuria leucospilota]